MRPKHAARPQKRSQREWHGFSRAKIEVRKDHGVNALAGIRVEVLHEPSKIIAIKREQALEDALLEPPIHPRHRQWHGANQVLAPEGIGSEALGDSCCQRAIRVQHSRQSSTAGCRVCLASLAKEDHPIQRGPEEPTNWDNPEIRLLGAGIVGTEELGMMRLSQNERQLRRQGPIRHVFP